MADRSHVAVVAVLVLALGAWWGFAALHQPLGEAPDFSLVSTGYEDSAMGEPVAFNLSDYRGRVVVLDLMAVNCAACETVADEVLRPIRAEFSEDQVVVLSVDTWADPDSGQAFAGMETREHLIALQEERDLAWRHALDTDDVWLKYAAIALPKVVVIDPEQQIVGEFTGEYGSVPRLRDVRAAVVDGLEGSAGAATGIRVPLLALAALAGVAAFFAPCSVGMVPAYLGMLARPTAGPAWTGTLQAGLAAGGGVLALYGALAAVLWAVGPWLAGHLGLIQVITGFALLGVGILMLRPGAWQRLARLGAGRVDGRRGLFAFGLAYGLASFGCTGPAFLPILVGAFAQGTATGVAAVAIYGGALVGLMLIAAALVAAGRHTALRRLLADATTVTRASAALFILAGTYVLWFHWRATGSLF